MSEKINYGKNIKKLVKFIKKSEEFAFFVVTSHDNPDADAVSASIAMEYLINSYKKRVLCVNSDPLPLNLTQLDYRHVVKQYDKITNSLNSEFNIENKFCLVVVDANEIRLTGKIAKSPLYDKAAKVVYVDHHLIKDELPQGVIVNNPDKTSACEIMYDIYKEANVKIPKEVGDALFAGIMADTGSFHYPKTSYMTLKIASKLAKNGTNPNEIYRLLYENDSIGSLILKKLVLGTLRLEFKNSIAIIELTKQMLDEAQIPYSQTGDLSNIPLMSSDVKAVLFFKENEKGEKKVAIRSKGDIDIAKVAAAHGGGGHKNAAGFKIKSEENIESLKQSLIAEISETIEQTK